MIGRRCVHKTYHRKEFDRLVKQTVPVNSDNVKRDYYWDKGEFNNMLEKYNETVQDKYDGDKVCYKCVGCANVRFRFCTYCYDVDKRNSKELYYVNTLQIAQHRPDSQHRGTHDRCRRRGCDLLECVCGEHAVVVFDHFHDRRVVLNGDHSQDSGCVIRDGFSPHRWHTASDG